MAGPEGTASAADGCLLNAEIIQVSPLRRLYRSALRRQPARRVSRRPGTLPVETMQAIANEMNFSETTFVLPRRAAGHRLPAAYFHAGHRDADGGASDDRQRLRAGARRRARAGARRLRVRPGVGPTPVSLTWKRKRPGLCVDDAAPADLFRRRSPIPAARPARWGCREAAVAGDRPAGAGRLVRRAVSPHPAGDAPRGRQRGQQLRERSMRSFAPRGVEASGVFLFSHERGGDKATVYSRMFAPELGVAEDPATGSASGPLGCYLVRHKVVPAGQGWCDTQPAGREDGTPQPRARVDRRRERATSPAFASAARRCSPAKATLYYLR